MRCCKYKATWQGLAGQAQEWSLLAAKHFYMRKARRYTTVVLTAFEERTVDCIVDCLSAPGLNPLMGNSGAPLETRVGYIWKVIENRKIKCEEHEIKKEFKKKRAKTPDKGSERRVGAKGYMQTTNGSKPTGTHNTRVETQVTLSVRQRRAEARQGGGRSGTPKINSKRYDAKI